jgi:WD40 repeat protein
MDISHSVDRIVSVDVGGVILLWDAGTAAVLHEIKAHKPCRGMAVAFSPDGKYFVVTHSQGFCYQYHTAKGIEIGCPFTPSNSAKSRCEMRAVAWAPSSKNYIVGYERGQVKYTINEGCQTIPTSYWDDEALDGSLWLKRREDAVNVLAISPDGKFVAVAGERVVGECNGWRRCGFVAVYNSPKSTLRWKDFATPGHDGGVWSLSFSLDGKQLASAGKDKFVRIWDPRDGTRLKAFQIRIPVTPLWQEQILMTVNIVSITFCANLEQTPERHERRLAFAQGHHKRLGALSILEVLSPDLMKTIGLMV